MSGGLEGNQRELVERADTFFVTSAHPRGASTLLTAEETLDSSRSSTRKRFSFRTIRATASSARSAIFSSIPRRVCFFRTSRDAAFCKLLALQKCCGLSQLIGTAIPAAHGYSISTSSGKRRCLPNSKPTSSTFRRSIRRQGHIPISAPYSPQTNPEILVSALRSSDGRRPRYTGCSGFSGA